VLRFGTARDLAGCENEGVVTISRRAQRLLSQTASMNSEICLQKSTRAGARRALLVIAVVAAWTVALIGIMQAGDADSASNTSPRIEKKAPEKPHDVFLIEARV
jgi:hypothetical protein